MQLKVLPTETRSKANITFSRTTQKHRKNTEKRMKSLVSLPKIVQGIHVAEEDSPLLQPRMNGGIKEEIMEERGKCSTESRER